LEESFKKRRLLIWSDWRTTIAVGNALADGCNLLSGVITQLSLERAGGVIGVADCGGISLRVRLSGQRTRELGLCPARLSPSPFPPQRLNSSPRVETVLNVRLTRIV
jgi:hypothetical protein